MLMYLLSIYTSLICLSPEQSSGEETDDESSEDESSSVESGIDGSLSAYEKMIMKNKKALQKKKEEIMVCYQAIVI